MKRKTKILNAINSLNKKDIYSLMLFTLFKLHDKKEYSTLSELCYILDGNNLPKLLNYYGGMTITIPTLREMRVLTQALLLYQYVNVEEGDFKAAITAVCGDEFQEEEIKKAYTDILEVISNYEFDRS